MYKESENLTYSFLSAPVCVGILPQYEMTCPSCVDHDREPSTASFGTLDVLFDVSELSVSICLSKSIETEEKRLPVII